MAYVTRIALLPKLEQPWMQVREQLGKSLALDKAALRDALMTALACESTYWYELAARWLEQGFPIDSEIAASVRESRDRSYLSQEYRHRALRVVRRWEQAREAELSVALGNPRSGWIEFSVRAGVQSQTHVFSYVYPSLTELCRGLAALLHGSAEATVVLLLEPDELVLAFRQSATDVEIETRLTRRGEQVFQHWGSGAKTVLAFWRALRRLQTGLSPERFRQEWGVGFPGEEMLALTEAVRQLKVGTESE
ncbi:MAG TPA: hypothetical protein VMF89_16295 [Polyangiales bacterium]|nr:hypothetical protein [Polyangiales bacterium]